MPVFVEEASSSRDSRVSPVHQAPLPRLSPPPAALSLPHEECYEVVVVGAGPAGMMLSVLLARYGITSVLTVDEKHKSVKSGQADGLQPRTLEVLQTLDLAHEVITQGCRMYEVGFWNPKNGGKGPGIERTAFVKDVSVPARFPHEITIHQGRIERILNEDLEKNQTEVQRSWRVTNWVFDHINKEYPVLVTMENTLPGSLGKQRRVRAKFLVGCDGARSVIRVGMGETLAGDHTDHVWGVMDSTVKTDFPDIRKRCAIHSPAGSIMIIPRERISHTQVLTRIYCQMEDAETDPSLTGIAETAEQLQEKVNAKKRREKVTLERIVSQTKKALEPYRIEFGEVDWWAAYQIGQRISPHFSYADPLSGLLRVHIAGDACHTHSPKAGQGMNVSMMDSYNLSWKLAHVIQGLAPDPNALLATYEYERLEVARQLIEFDRKFSSMFSGKIGDGVDGSHGLTHEEFVEVFSTGGGFTSGCGIEYQEGLLVKKINNEALLSPIIPGVPESGLLTPGRRLLNVKVKRFCDAYPRDIQDDLPSNGRYRILLLPPSIILTLSNPTILHPLITLLTEAIPASYPPSMIETILIHPWKSNHEIEWHSNFPPNLRQSMGGMGEWLVFSDEIRGGEIGGWSQGGEKGAYETWGVKKARGAVAVIRPDGVVGCVVGCMEDGWSGKAVEMENGVREVERIVRAYFDGVLKRVV